MTVSFASRLRKQELFDGSDGCENEAPVQPFKAKDSKREAESHIYVGEGGRVVVVGELNNESWEDHGEFVTRESKAAKRERMQAERIAEENRLKRAAIEGQRRREDQLRQLEREALQAKREAEKREKAEKDAEEKALTKKSVAVSRENLEISSTTPPAVPPPTVPQNSPVTPPAPKANPPKAPSPKTKRVTSTVPQATVPILVCPPAPPTAPIQPTLPSPPSPPAPQSTPFVDPAIVSRGKPLLSKEPIEETKLISENRPNREAQRLAYREKKAAREQEQKEKGYRRVGTKSSVSMASSSATTPVVPEGPIALAAPVVPVAVTYAEMGVQTDAVRVLQMDEGKESTTQTLEERRKPVSAPSVPQQPWWLKEPSPNQGMGMGAPQPYHHYAAASSGLAGYWNGASATPYLGEGSYWGYTSPYHQGNPPQRQ